MGKKQVGRFWFGDRRLMLTKLWDLCSTRYVADMFYKGKTSLEAVSYSEVYDSV